jgi:hypothetical protein
MISDFFLLCNDVFLYYSYYILDSFPLISDHSFFIWPVISLKSFQKLISKFVFEKKICMIKVYEEANYLTNYIFQFTAWNA